MEKVNYYAGMVLTSTWGYGQTNVSWYKVVKISPSGKTVTLQEYDGTYTASEENYMCGTEVIDLSEKVKGTFTKRVGDYMRPKSYMGSFDVWDGKPMFVSHWN